MLILISIFINNNKTSTIFRSYESEDHLRVINKSLEILEISLREANKKNICIETRNTAKLIEDNINGLKNIEPNYNWEDIKDVLIDISTKKCITPK